MNKDLHQIDDLFRKGLEGKEEIPGNNVWSSIEQELDRKKDRKPVAFFFRDRKVAAILLAVLGSAALFAGGYLFRAHQEEQRNNSPQPVKEQQRAPRTKDGNATAANEAATTGKQQQAPDGYSAREESHPATVGPVIKSMQAESSGLPQHQQETTAPVKISKARVKQQKTKSVVNESALADPVKESMAVKPPSSQIKNNRPTAGKWLENTPRQTSQGKAAEIEALTSKAPEPSPEQRSVAEEAAEKENPAPSEALDEALSKTWTKASVPERSRQINAPSLLNSPSRSSIPVAKRRSAVDLPRFSITPMVAWQTGSNRIEPSAGAQGSKLASEIKRTETQHMKLAVGLLADLRIAQRMTVQTGAIYTQRTIEIQPKYITAEKNPDGKIRYRFDCSAGSYFLKPKSGNYPRPGDSAITRFSTNELNYLNIPLNVTYHFGGPRWHFFAVAGAGINLLTDQYLETGLKYGMYDEEDSRTTNLRSNYWNGNIGMGIKWQASRSLGFQLSPQYQFGLSPINENMGIQAIPRVFSVQAGAAIKIK